MPESWLAEFRRTGVSVASPSEEVARTEDGVDFIGVTVIGIDLEHLVRPGRSRSTTAASLFNPASNATCSTFVLQLGRWVCTIRRTRSNSIVMLEVSILIAGESPEVSDLAASGRAATIADRYGYAVCEIRRPLDDMSLNDPTFSLAGLSHRCEKLLRESVGDDFEWIRRYWYPVAIVPSLDRTAASPEMKSFEGLQFELRWDGGCLVGSSASTASALKTVANALMYSYGVGHLASRARSAIADKKATDREAIRSRLEQGIALLDPRVDVYWEVDHVILDELRRNWRTSEIEEVSERAVRSLEYLIADRRSTRLRQTLLLLTVISGMGIPPSLIDFATAESPMTPTSVARPLVALSVFVVSLMIWFSLRNDTG